MKKIILLICLICIFILLLITLNLPLKEIKDGEDGEKVYLIDNIKEIKYYSGESIILLYNSPVKVIIFSNYLDLKENDFIKITGKLQNNKKEIIADKISKL